VEINKYKTGKTREKINEIKYLILEKINVTEQPVVSPIRKKKGDLNYQS
jgi:hypothetical protein